MHHPQNSTSGETQRLIAGRYRLGSRIGSGAMGSVWSGTDELLQRPVAIKEVQLSREVPDEEAAEFRERALREARALAVVTHPNVVMLYDVAEDDGGPFVVMELVAAESLSGVLKRDSLTQHQLAVIVDGVAAALQAAHRVGIVHRDVKPGNVLLGAHGQVKLGDFGISRNPAESTLTRTGVLLGTPAFVAPEIVLGESPGPEADLWSLGATLFAAAEGKLPYDSDDALITLSSIIHGPVPQHQQTGEIGAVLNGLMIKDPARRMSLHEVRRNLASLVRNADEATFDSLLSPSALALRDHETVQFDPVSASGPTAPGTTPAAPPPSAAKAAKPVPARPWAATLLGTVAGALVVAGTGAGFYFGRAGLVPPGSTETPSSQDANRPGTPPPAGGLNAYSSLQAESFAQQSGDIGTGQTGEPDKITFAGPLKDGDVLRFEKVRFDSPAAKQVSARFLSWNAPGVNAKIEIVLDDPANTPIGKINITPSGGAWKSVPFDIKPVTGTHVVYLKVASAKPGEFVDVDSFQFHR